MNQNEIDAIIAENEQLKKKVNDYEKIFSTVEAYIFIYCANKHKVIWANRDDYMAENLRLEEGEEKLSLSENFNLVKTDDKAIIFERLNYFLSNKGDTFPCTYSIIAKDGTEKQIYSVSKILDQYESGQIKTIVGFSSFLDFEFLKKHGLKSLLKKIVKYIIFEDDFYTLFTPKEIEVLDYFIKDKTAKEACIKLNISPYTLNHHISHINRKILKKLLG